MGTAPKERPRLPAESEVEGGAAVDGRLGPNPAAVPVDDALDGGQADAGAGVLRRGVQPLEGREQHVGVGHVEAGAVIAYEEDRRLAVLAAELEVGPRPAGRELPGVAEQVVEQAAQQNGVAQHREARGAGEVHHPGRVGGAQLGDGGAGQLTLDRPSSASISRPMRSAL